MNTDDVITPPQQAHVIEHAIERTIFATRWLLVPFYLGLVAGLVPLLATFGQKAADLVTRVWTGESINLTLRILELIDLCLVANLIVMIVFAGYETFVSRLDVGSNRLAWMGRIGFGDLKLRLVASIVAISAIHLLEDFMDVAHLTDREMGWRLGIHVAFVVSGVLLACMDRLADARH